ncbi:hypothetical protein D4764_0186800 [Takifugu flavidus]|uniref:Uncharacterized protein n=1 Tax=Takifugu flavidus TaxID=433684 RepID=A0A5C6MII4_9TELE|nr:hypothetical protein D4764_0186800 [Takifugu flavidus]
MPALTPRQPCPTPPLPPVSLPPWTLLHQRQSPPPPPLHSPSVPPPHHLPPVPPSSPPSFTISEQDVRRQFARLNPRKAPGPDGVSPSTLRHWQRS